MSIPIGVGQTEVAGEFLNTLGGDSLLDEVRNAGVAERTEGEGLGRKGESGL